MLIFQFPTGKERQAATIDQQVTWDLGRGDSEMDIQESGLCNGHLPRITYSFLVVEERRETKPGRSDIKAEARGVWKFVIKARWEQGKEKFKGKIREKLKERSIWFTIAMLILFYYCLVLHTLPASILANLLPSLILHALSKYRFPLSVMAAVTPADRPTIIAFAIHSSPVLPCYLNQLQDNDDLLWIIFMLVQDAGSQVVECKFIER
jgi:hypothetical protein